MRDPAVAEHPAAPERGRWRVVAVVAVLVGAGAGAGVGIAVSSAMTARRSTIATFAPNSSIFPRIAGVNRSLADAGHPGETVTLGIYRGSRRLSVTFTLGTVPAPPSR